MRFTKSTFFDVMNQIPVSINDVISLIITMYRVMYMYFEACIYRISCMRGRGSSNNADVLIVSVELPFTVLIIYTSKYSKYFLFFTSLQQATAANRESFLLCQKCHRSIHVHTVIGLDSTTVSESFN